MNNHFNELCLIPFVFRTEPGCSIEGQGGLKTKFEIDLKKPAGAAGSCGVKYNAVSFFLYFPQQI